MIFSGGADMRIKQVFKGFLEWLLCCPMEDETFDDHLVEAGYLFTFQLAVAVIALILCKTFLTL